jgi:hypothetical protein
MGVVTVGGWVGGGVGEGSWLPERLVPADNLSSGGSASRRASGNRKMVGSFSICSSVELCKEIQHTILLISGKEY